MQNPLLTEFDLAAELAATEAHYLRVYNGRLCGCMDAQSLAKAKDAYLAAYAALRAYKRKAMVNRYEDWD